MWAGILIDKRHSVYSGQTDRQAGRQTGKERRRRERRGEEAGVQTGHTAHTQPTHHRTGNCTYTPSRSDSRDWYEAGAGDGASGRSGRPGPGAVHGEGAAEQQQSPGASTGRRPYSAAARGGHPGGHVPSTAAGGRAQYSAACTVHTCAAAIHARQQQACRGAAPARAGRRVCVCA